MRRTVFLETCFFYSGPSVSSQKALYAKEEFKARSLKVQLGVLRGEIRARGGVVPESLHSKDQQKKAAKEAKQKAHEEKVRERRR